MYVKNIQHIKHKIVCNILARSTKHLSGKPMKKNKNSTPLGVAVVNSSAFLCSHCCPHDPEKSKFTLNSQLTLQTVAKMAKC